MENCNQSNPRTQSPSIQQAPTVTGKSGGSRRSAKSTVAATSKSEESSNTTSSMKEHESSTRKISEGRREYNRLRQQRKRRKLAAKKRQGLQTEEASQQPAQQEKDTHFIDDSGNDCKNDDNTDQKDQIRSIDSKTGVNPILHWPSDALFVPLQQEKQMVDILMQRNGRRERGMLKDKPQFVLQKFWTAMRQHAPAMKMNQLCSLRRHHIKHLNPDHKPIALGLGSEKDIKESARLFERAVQKYLKKEKIPFETEESLRAAARQQKIRLQGTPDFVFPTQPITLRKIQNGRVVEELIIHWLEVKMFYGASTIPHGSKGAVGSVLAKAQKYNDMFGKGALLFMFGCGEQLASDLRQIGVTVLDCCSETSPVDLHQVHNHQRKWCANSEGYILP
ncbi:TPD sequence-motif-containing protein [Nitzschia inconspicua]|uniref:TPD sequence-motif-containing protein n=1 Tax=Nitzschia inconspicua TaxID=303405 RepID=A0A9K3L710_9STRA|nr:TPD sequence-motif-containing protein [Nitzschia inconspicua]